MTGAILLGDRGKTSDPFLWATVQAGASGTTCQVLLDGSPDDPVTATLPKRMVVSAGDRVMVFAKGTGLYVWQRMATGAATYWLGAGSGESGASTTAAWTGMLQIPSVIHTDDSSGSTFTPVGGGIKITQPGRYTVELCCNISGGVANVRMGLGLMTVEDSTHIIPAGGSFGSPMAGYSLTGVSTNNGQYFSLTRPFIVFDSATIGSAYYCQTTTSHNATITHLMVLRTD